MKIEADIISVTPGELYDLVTGNIVDPFVGHFLSTRFQFFLGECMGGNGNKEKQEEILFPLFHDGKFGFQSKTKSAFYYPAQSCAFV